MTFRSGAGVLFMCIWIASGAAVGKAQELTEQAALSRFAAENQTLRALEAGVRIAQAEARRAGLYPNPAVTFSRR